MMNGEITRRAALRSMAALYGGASCSLAAGSAAFHLATFSAEVTPPLGHPLLAGCTVAPPASRIDDPLYALGFVLLGRDKPVVVVCVDWCEIRNDAHERWRQVLAEAAGTDPSRVLVSALHQHDTPLPDLDAQRILEKHGAKGKIFDLDFHEKTIQRVGKAVKDSLKSPRGVTHFGIGQAKVKEVASNRRYLGPDGKPRFDRSSMSGKDKYKADQPEETIDPWLKTLSFWDGDRAVCALNAYAVHPMSYWGTGWVTCDFPGLARKRRQADDPKVFQIYASGASGNVTAGKYNDGNHGNRAILAGRLYQGMVEAWKNTKKHVLEKIQFRSVAFRLEPRNSAGFTIEELTKDLSHPDPKKQCLAAMGLSWRKRADAGHKLDFPCLDFGPAQVILLPGESYVEYQLLAQKLRPDSFVLVMGYGEGATGYVPIDKAWEENDGNLYPWCWIEPNVEKKMTEAMTRALAKMK